MASYLCIHLFIYLSNIIENSLLFFKNLSIDLIYGVPNSGLQSLDKDLRLLQYYDIKHVSTYALTVESKTLLEFQINKNLIILIYLL